MFQSVAVFLLCALLNISVTARPFNSHQLDVYDYIVIGGGTSGLTVANRLTEDPDVTVLVLEAGQADDFQQGIMVPVFVGSDVYSTYDWYFETVPQTFCDGATRRIPQGRAVGGGTILNAMLWNRGGQGDYNDWEALGNPGWGWYSMLPYFMKSETYTPVFSKQVADEYSIHFDPSVHGFSGPVNVSFPHYFYETSVNFFDGLNALGVPTVYDPNTANAAGATYLPLDISPTNQSRADARRSYYDPYAARQNFYVSTGQYVTRIIFEDKGCAKNYSSPAPRHAKDRNGNSAEPNASPSLRAVGVEYAVDASSPRNTVLARREVIVAAGSLQSPKVLELSGIGQPSILENSNISVLLDLPGVGNNLQDHYLVGTYYQFFNNSYIYSNQLNVNATLNAQAEAEYYANRTGPWTAGPADGNAFPSLSQITNQSQAMVADAGTQAPSDHLAQGLDKTIIAGYAAQLRLLVQALADPARAAIELLNSNAGNLSPSVMRPFSRGTTHISSSDPFDPPSINPRYGSNPIDLDVLYESLLFNRRLLSTPTMAELLPLQWAPPADADEQALRTFIANGIGTEYHPSATCAMLPKSLGGVVDPSLLVYGTENVRVVDASIFPMIPAAHLQAVVYAVAEKAADIIKTANANLSPADPVLPSGLPNSCPNTTTSRISYNATSSQLRPSSSSMTFNTTASWTNTTLPTNYPSQPSTTPFAPSTSITQTSPGLSSKLSSSSTQIQYGTSLTFIPSSTVATTHSASSHYSIASIRVSAPPYPGPFPGYSPIPPTPARPSFTHGPVSHSTEMRTFATVTVHESLKTSAASSIGPTTSVPVGTSAATSPSQAPNGGPDGFPSNQAFGDWLQGILQWIRDHFGGGGGRPLH